MIQKFKPRNAIDLDFIKNEEHEKYLCLKDIVNWLEKTKLKKSDKRITDMMTDLKKK